MSDSQPTKTKSDDAFDSELHKNENINLKLNESSDSDSDSEKKISKSSSSDSESLSESIDEERITLGQINKLARKKQKSKENMDVKSFLQRKRHLDDNVITYDEKNGKILQEFCGSIEELNEFLSKCEIKKITFDDISDMKNTVAFDPNEWMKANNIFQRTMSLEDLVNLNEKKEKNEKIRRRYQRN